MDETHNSPERKSTTGQPRLTTDQVPPQTLSTLGAGATRQPSASTQAWQVPPSLGAAGLQTVPGYEVLSELGRGGMGVVYRARNARLGHEVALKMILAGGHAGSQDLARFQLEAASVARLKHAGIVHLYEFGEYEGKPYFSLEFVDGGSLSGRLKQGSLSAFESAEMVEKVARAMHHAHEHGIIHRDLKPANVLLTKEGEPKVADFGLAKDLDHDDGLSRTGVVMGTPSYMAPEQAEGRIHDIRAGTDVYALGAILYECLTGQVVFKGATIQETLEMVSRREPVGPRTVNHSVPRDLETVCLRCLEKDPKKRYATAADLADDLGRFLRGEPVVARPVGVVGRGVRWCGRNRAVAGLLGAVAAALMIGTAVSLFFAFQAMSKAEDERIARGDEAKAREDADAKREFAEQQQRRAEKEWNRAETESAARLVQLGRARSALMTSQIRNAALLCERDPFQALNLLDDEDLCPVQVRDFTWGLHRRWCRRDRAVLTGPDKSFRDVAYTPDGRFLIAGGGNGMYWFDGTSGREIATHSRPFVVDRVVISPDGKNTVTIEGGANLYLYETGQSRERLYLRGHKSTIRDAAFSPNGGLVASGSDDGTVRIFDTATGRERSVLKKEEGLMSSLCWSPDGSTLFETGGAGAIRLRDPMTGETRRTIKGDADGVWSLAISPDGKTLAGGCGAHDKPGVVRLWNAASGAEVASWTGHGSMVGRLAWSRDGKLLASGDRDGIVRIRETATGSELVTLAAHVGFVSGLAFSPDGATLASSGIDRAVRLWDVKLERSRTLASIGSGEIGSLAFGPEGKTLAAGGGVFNSNGSVVLWDAVSGKPGAVFDGHKNLVMAVAFRPDGKTLASAGLPSDGEDNFIRLWNLGTGKPSGTLDKHPNGVWTLAFSPDGTLLASGGGDRLIHVYDVDKRTEWTVLKGHSEVVQSIAFSPDGRSLVSAGQDNTIRIWDLASASTRATMTGHAAIITCVRFSPDGKTIASASLDRTIRLWDAETGTGRSTLKGNARPVHSLDFSPDGRTLASSGGEDGMPGEIQLWDVVGEQVRATLPQQPGTVSNVRFSPDGVMLATAGRKGLVNIWEARISRDDQTPRLLLDIDAALVRKPKNPALHLRRALALSRDRRWDEARKELTLTSDLAKDSVAVALAEHLLESRAGRDAEAKAALERAVNATPSLPPLSPETGWAGRPGPDKDAKAPTIAEDVLLAVEEELAAGARSAQSSAYDPGVAWRVCALARRKMGDQSRAGSDSAAALGLSPRDEAARRVRLWTAVETSDRHTAIATAFEWTDQQPEAWEPHYLMGIVRDSLNRSEESIESLTTAIAKGGDGSAVRRFRARIAARVRKHELAIADYTVVLKKLPNDADALHGRAASYEATNRLAEATADYVRAMPGAAAHEYLWGLQADFHMKHKQWDHAADLLALTVGNRPDDGGVRETARAIYHQFGVRSRAVDLYSRLVKAHPKHLRIRRESAELNAQYSRWKEAVEDYDVLIGPRPMPNDHVGFEIACLRLLAGDADGSRTSASRMLEWAEKSNVRPFLVARACTVGELPRADVLRAEKAADQELKQNASESWAMTQRAALEVRLGRHAQGEAMLRKCLKDHLRWEGRVVPRLWLALALHGQGRKDDARNELAVAVAQLDRWGKSFPYVPPGVEGGLHLHDWLEAQILRREAETRLSATKP